MIASGRTRKAHDELPAFPIAQVLQELGADIVPTGFGWVRMRCFAHEDRTASAAVNHELNAYRCHSCGIKGDSLKLLQDQLHLSFRGALDKAKELTGMEPGSRKARTRRASDLLKGGA